MIVPLAAHPVPHIFAMAGFGALREVITAFDVVNVF
jgi:hypothetical protein